MDGINQMDILIYISLVEDQKSTVNITGFDLRQLISNHGSELRRDTPKPSSVVPLNCTVCGTIMEHYMYTLQPRTFSQPTNTVYILLWVLMGYDDTHRVNI